MLSAWLFFTGEIFLTQTALICHPQKQLTGHSDQIHSRQPNFDSINRANLKAYKDPRNILFRLNVLIQMFEIQDVTREWTLSGVDY